MPSHFSGSVGQGSVFTLPQHDDIVGFPSRSKLVRNSVDDFGFSARGCHEYSVRGLWSDLYMDKVHLFPQKSMGLALVFFGGSDGAPLQLARSRLLDALNHEAGCISQV